MTATSTLVSTANQDRSHAEDIIRAAYRQVFGNRYLMELDVQPSIEALFINGDLTVQGLVTALAQSETYRRLYLETNSPYRFVELNFKHLLGRAPHDQAELMAHVRLMNEEGYEAEIASYTYSEEYLSAFGVDQVPYNRSNQTNTGGRTVNFSRAKAVDTGFASFDGATQGSKLLESLSTGIAPDIIDRKSVGNAGALRITWTSGRQIGANRRSVQRSVITQTSMSATIQSILKQGGRIVSISKT